MYLLLVFMIYIAHSGAMTVNDKPEKTELLEEYADIMEGTFDNIDQVDCEESFGKTPPIGHTHTSLLLIKDHPLLKPGHPNKPTTYHFMEQYSQRDPTQVFRRRIYESTITEIEGKNVVWQKIYRIANDER